MAIAFFPNNRLRFLWCVIGIIPLVVGISRFCTDYPLVLAVFSFYVLLPGYLLQYLLLSPQNYLEKAAYTFSFGLLWNACIFCIFAVMDLPFQSILAKLIPAVLIAALALFVWSRRLSPPARKRMITLCSVDFVVAAICLLYMVFLQYSESSTILGSDGLTHIDHMSRMLAQGSSGKIGHSFKDIILRTRLWHDSIQPYFLLITGSDGIGQYLILTSLIAPFVLCSFYTFTRALHPSPSFHLLSILLFALHFGGFISNPSHSNYSWYVCWAMIFTALASVVNGIRDKRTFNLGLGLILGLASIFYHFNYFLIFLGSALLIFLAYIFWVSRISSTRKLILAFILLILLFVPTILSVFGIIPSLVSDARIPALHHAPNIHTTRLFEKDVVVSYKSYLRWSGFLGTVAIFLLPLVWRKPKSPDEDKIHGLTRGYLILGMIFPFMVVFNPAYVLVGYLIIGEWGFYIYRLFYMCPYISVVALALGTEQGNVSGRYSALRKGLTVVVFLCVLPVFAFQFLHYLPTSLACSIQDYTAQIIPFHRVPFRYDHAALTKAMAYIKGSLGNGHKFISDPLTSWMIFAATSNDVLNKAKRPEKIRLSPSMKVLSQKTDMTDTRKILTKYKVDYILVNTTFSEQIYKDYLSVSDEPGNANVFLGKFLANPGFFDLIYSQEGIFIFRVKKISNTE